MSDRMRWKQLLCLVLAAMLLVLPRSGGAQQVLEVQNVKVDYDFGRQIRFEARILTPGVQQASLFFRRADEDVTRVEPLTLDADGMARFTYEASLNLIPPFSTILFWFQAALAGGGTLTSPQLNFRYDDNRFAWQQAADGALTVHWYQGDDAFGQAALDAARQGSAAVTRLLGPVPDAPLDLYVYSNPEDLRGALPLGGAEWVGGHADPSVGAAMVVIPPGESQAIAMETGIPHELAHVLLYRFTGSGYDALPAWLNEGIASLAEAYPKPDYAGTLAAAARDGSLIPLADLCTSFPVDAGRAFLAYAQSQSFTRYLRDTFGTTGLSALIHSYADGMDCEDGARQAVGMPLSRLEARWRESALAQNPAGAALRGLAPYLVVMGLALLIPLLGAVNMAAEKRRNERRSK